MIDRFLASRWSAFTAWALASMPLVVSVVLAARRGEWMAGDRSIMGLYTHDVFSSHPPLLGTASTLGLYTAAGGPTDTVYHLGPAQFYALAVPDWLASGHPAGLYAGGLLVNLTAIAVVVWGARRRLGPAGGSLASLAMVGLGYGLGATLLRDIWTPHLGLWPLLALLVTTWSLVDGDVKALPWAALAASFLAQIELLFVGPALVLTLTGVVGLVVHRVRHRDDPDRPSLRRPAVISAVLSAVVWLPVVIQEATGNPGNLTLLIRSLGAQKDRAPLSFVGGNLVAFLQVPPIFLRRERLPFEVGAHTSVAAAASAALVLGALGWLSVRAVRGQLGSPTIRAMLITSWAMVLGGALNLLITPAEGIIGLQYRRWMWPGGTFIWLTLLVGGAHQLRHLLDDYDLGWSERTVSTATAVGALGLAALAIVPATTGQHSPMLESVGTRRSIEVVWDSVFDDLPPQPTYVSMAGADAAFAIGPEIIRRLDVHGWPVRVDAVFEPSFGAHRVLTADRPAAQTLQLVSDETTLVPGDVPVQVLAAGGPSGRSDDEFLRRVAPLLERARVAAPFALTDDGRRELQGRWGDDPNAAQAIDDLLASPTRTMFDEGVLDLQLAGQVTSSPLSDEEARWLRDELRRTEVVAYLLAAPGA